MRAILDIGFDESDFGQTEIVWRQQNSASAFAEFKNEVRRFKAALHNQIEHNFLPPVAA